MLSTSNVAIQFGAKPLFEQVTVKFTDGNRYGLIGANGCGKSTFMKLLSGELEQPVPQLEANAARPISNVTWRVRGKKPGDILITATETKNDVSASLKLSISKAERQGILD